MAILITSHFSRTCLQILRISDLAIGMYASYSKRTTVFPDKKSYLLEQKYHKFHFYFRESTIALQQLTQFWNNNLLLDVRLRKLLTLVDSDLFMDKQILLTGGIWKITAYSQFVIFEA